MWDMESIWKAGLTNVAENCKIADTDNLNEFKTCVILGND